MFSHCPNVWDVPPKSALYSHAHNSNCKGCSIYSDHQHRKNQNQVSNNINPKNLGFLIIDSPVRATSIHPSVWLKPTYKLLPTVVPTILQLLYQTILPPASDTKLGMSSYLNDFKMLITLLTTLLLM